MLCARDICCRLGGVDILRDVSIDVAPGEVVAVIGPNGAGKSTLMQVLTGDLAATSGAVTIDGVELSRWTPYELAQKRAVVHQSSSTQFPITAYDVISMGRLAYRRTSLKMMNERIILHAARSVGVEPLLTRLYPTLSGGESQRVHLARAIAQLGNAPSGKLLVLDEPTSALDPSHVASFLTLIRALARELNIAVLCVLHDLNAVSACADRVVALRDGRVVASGATAVVLSETTLRDIYGPGLSLIRADDGRLAVIPSLSTPDEPRRDSSATTNVEQKPSRRTQTPNQLLNPHSKEITCKP